jgi:hypothetical protein
MPSIDYDAAVARVDAVAPRLFASDPRVRVVGLSLYGEGFGFRVVRNTKVILPSSAKVENIERIDELRVHYVDVASNLSPLTKVPYQGPGSPRTSSFGREQEQHRPVFCGLQIQNFDYDQRSNNITNGYITIGTLGCFVQINPSQQLGFLSNNHVMAGENSAATHDRILQPGAGIYDQADRIGELHNFVHLQFSPSGATPQAGTAVMNDSDAAVALLDGTIRHSQTCETYGKRQLKQSTTAIQIGDIVYKVGRTSGPSKGEIVAIAAVTGPVEYDSGPAWFRQSLVIQGQDETRFSDRGDSGAVIARASTNEALGLLYAGNDTDTYACPIDPALQALNCTIV